MNIKQVANRLTSLGFTMGAVASIPNWGRKDPEIFTTNLHVMSPPFRDVFIGKAKGGWYITSHIKFKARRFHARLHNTFTEEMKNIFGHGRTLELAIADFEKEYIKKVYPFHESVPTCLQHLW